MADPWFQKISNRKAEDNFCKFKIWISRKSNFNPENIINQVILYTARTYAALEFGPRFLPGPLNATFTNRRLYWIRLAARPKNSELREHVDKPYIHEHSAAINHERYRLNSSKKTSDKFWGYIQSQVQSHICHVMNYKKEISRTDWPVFFFFFSCFSTFGVWARTLPARAREPCTLPEKVQIHCL